MPKIRSKGSAMPAPKEPKAQTDLDLLIPYFQDRIVLLLANLEAKGWRPRVFETWRSGERQEWLYGVGRTHHLASYPVTWTHTSKHMIELKGLEAAKAVDIIHADEGWKNLAFFRALKREAKKIPGLVDYRGGLDWDTDKAHVEWGGLK